MDYRKRLFKFIVLCAVFVFCNGSAKAANLKFDPSSISATSGKAFTVNVNVEAGSEQITSVDVFITYDSTMFSLGSTPVTAGSFFPSTANVTSQPGKVYIAGLVTDAGTYRTGSGTLATVSFIPKNTGTSTMTFDCTSGVTASDSNIIKNDTNSSDIITCSDNNSFSVDVNGSSLTTTPTPSGYRTPTPTSTSTATAVNPASTYNSNGKKIKVYDANGNPIDVTLTGGNGIKVYDANGKEIKVYDANGNEISVAPANDSVSTLPQTGTFENVMKYSLPGGILLLAGGLLLLL